MNPQCKLGGFHRTRQEGRDKTGTPHATQEEQILKGRSQVGVTAMKQENDEVVWGKKGS